MSGILSEVASFYPLTHKVEILPEGRRGEERERKRGGLRITFLKKNQYTHKNQKYQYCNFSCILSEVAFFSSLTHKVEILPEGRRRREYKRKRERQRGAIRITYLRITII